MTTTEITLPDSGATIRVKRISPMTLIAIERANPDPKPPLQEVDYGNGSKRREPNPLDPAYQQALLEHQQTKNLLVLQAFIRLGVEVEIDAARLAAYRADMQALGVELPADDKYIYVANILCETNNDLGALRAGIEGRSIPTEQGVSDKLETFPGDVQGTGPVEVEGAAVGGDV